MDPWRGDERENERRVLGEWEIHRKGKRKTEREKE